MFAEMKTIILQKKKLGRKKYIMFTFYVKKNNVLSSTYLVPFVFSFHLFQMKFMVKQSKYQASITVVCCTFNHIRTVHVFWNIWVDLSVCLVQISTCMRAHLRTSWARTRRSHAPSALHLTSTTYAQTSPKTTGSMVLMLLLFLQTSSLSTDAQSLSVPFGWLLAFLHRGNNTRIHLAGTFIRMP